MQAKKIGQFLRARDAYNQGIIKSKRQAILTSGLSATTYYKYEKSIGNANVQNDTSNIIDTHFDVDKQTTKQLTQENAKLKKMLFDKFLKENGL